MPRFPPRFDQAVYLANIYGGFAGAQTAAVECTDPGPRQGRFQRDRHYKARHSRSGLGTERLEMEGLGRTGEDGGIRTQRSGFAGAVPGAKRRAKARCSTQIKGSN